MDLDKAIAHRLHAFKQVKRTLDAHKAKASSISLRKEWLAAQKRTNYQSEYDRVRELLSQTILPAGAKRLEAREAELRKLGITGPSLIV